VSSHGEQRRQGTAFAQSETIPFFVNARLNQALTPKSFAKVLRALLFAKRGRGYGTNADMLVGNFLGARFQECKRAPHAVGLHQLLHKWVRR